MMEFPLILLAPLLFVFVFSVAIFFGVMVGRSLKLLAAKIIIIYFKFVLRRLDETNSLAKFAKDTIEESKR